MREKTMGRFVGIMWAVCIGVCLALAGCELEPTIGGGTWRLTVSPRGNPLILSPGATVRFTARAITPDNHVLPADITWQADAAIGVIDATGLFTATTDAGSDDPQTGAVTISDGTHTVRVPIEVTVTAGNVTTLLIEPADRDPETPLAIGDVAHYTAVGLDASGNRGADARVLVEVDWGVEGGVGSITPAGDFTAWIAGAGAITAVTASGTPLSARLTIAVVGPTEPCAIVPEPDYIPPETVRAAEAVPGEFIVRFDDADAGLASVRDMGGEVVYAFHRIAAAVVRLPASASRALAFARGVRYVEPNYRVSVARPGGAGTRQDDVGLSNDRQALSWNVDILDAERVWAGADGATHVVAGSPAGAGVTVALVDTGIDADHPDLSVLDGTNIVNEASTFDDDFGHGTAVAGIIAARDNDVGGIGIAPECDLLAVKVLDRYGVGSVANVERGIEWAADHGAQVINMSLGITFLSDTLRDLCNQVWDNGNGALLVAASGNVPQDDYPAWPGNFGSVISTAATDEADAWPDFSLAGFPVELAGPGVLVPTAAMGGGYQLVDGTSFATGHVSGAAALVRSTGHFVSAGRIRQQLRDTAVDLGNPGRDPLFGYGRVNAFAAATDLTCADQ